MIFCCCKDPLFFFYPEYAGGAGVPSVNDVFSTAPNIPFHSFAFNFDYSAMYPPLRAVDRNNDIYNFYKKNYEYDLLSSPYFSSGYVSSYEAYTALGYNAFTASLTPLLLTPPPSVCGFFNTIDLSNEDIQTSFGFFPALAGFMTSDYVIELGGNTFISPHSSKYYSFRYYNGRFGGMDFYPTLLHRYSDLLKYGLADFFRIYPERIVLRDIADPWYTSALKDMGFSNDDLLLFHLNYLIRQTFTRQDSHFDGNLRALGVLDTDIALFNAHNSFHTEKYLYKLFHNNQRTK